MRAESQQAIDQRLSRVPAFGPELDEVVTHLRLLNAEIRAMNVKKISQYELEVSYNTAAGELPFSNPPAVQHESCDNEQPLQ